MWTRTSGFQSSKLHFSDISLGGFTLLEILIVLLMVSVLVGVTVPNLPAVVDTADYDLEARRLELLLNMARGEAVLDSVEYGFDLTEQGYEFFRYDDTLQRWRRQESPFQARRLPDSLRLIVRVADPVVAGVQSGTKYQVAGSSQSCWDCRRAPAEPTRRHGPLSRRHRVLARQLLC